MGFARQLRENPPPPPIAPPDRGRFHADPAPSPGLSPVRILDSNGAEVGFLSGRDLRAAAGRKRAEAMSSSAIQGMINAGTLDLHENPEDAAAQKRPIGPFVVVRPNVWQGLSGAAKWARCNMREFAPKLEANPD